MMQPRNYIDAIALEIWREVMGDVLLPTAHEMPLWRIYAVLVLARGEATTPRDVHDAWSAWCAERDPGHRSLVTFDELPPSTRALDEPYCDAIRAVARRVRRWYVAETQ